MRLLHLLSPVSILLNLLSALLTLAFLAWFGLTCFKLGWYAQESPFWHPVVWHTLMQ